MARAHSVSPDPARCVFVHLLAVQQNGYAVDLVYRVLRAAQKNKIYFRALGSVQPLESHSHLFFRDRNGALALVIFECLFQGRCLRRDTRNVVHGYRA